MDLNIPYYLWWVYVCCVEAVVRGAYSGQLRTVYRCSHVPKYYIHATRFLGSGLALFRQGEI
uniref:Uncharacterized protein n=1 Tax=Arundo donax TaxID=35708 RepID=A0A0A9B0C6_ARUDO